MDEPTQREAELAERCLDCNVPLAWHYSGKPATKPGETCFCY